MVEDIQSERKNTHIEEEEPITDGLERIRPQNLKVKIPLAA